MTTDDAIELRAASPPARTMRLEPRDATELIALAKILAQSTGGLNSVPDIVAAALRGERHGWGVVHSIDSYHVIKGNPTMKPEAMLGIIRAAGHSVQIDLAGDAATVTARRADTGDTMTTTFSVADAKRIGLNSNPSWKNYPQQMCQWRAVSQMAKALFSDLLAGYYTAEELGAAVDAEGVVVEARDGSDAAVVVDAEVVEFDRAAAKQSLVGAYRGVYDATDGCERDATADAAEQWQAHVDAHGEPVDDETIAAMVAEGLTIARANTLNDQAASETA